MEVVHERCCGLDVHKASVVACVLTNSDREVRTFGTTTRELLRLSDWLKELGVRAVAMESSGVYWKPIFNILEESDFELLVANARHMKAVPGRKTDVKDAQWIAELHRHGLLEAAGGGQYQADSRCRRRCHWPQRSADAGDACGGRI